MEFNSEPTNNTDEIFPIEILTVIKAQNCFTNTTLVYENVQVLYITTTCGRIYGLMCNT